MPFRFGCVSEVGAGMGRVRRNSKDEHGEELWDMESSLDVC